MSQVVWRTVTDIAIDLGIDNRAVYRLWKKGILQGVGENITNLRIADPGPLFADKMWNRNLDHFQFITTNEFAEVLGIKHRALQKRIERGGPRPSGAVFQSLLKTRHMTRIMRVSNRNMEPIHFFTRTEVRRYLAQTGKRSGQLKQKYSPIVVKWLREWLAKQQASASIIDALMKETVSVPEPDRSRIATKLWDLFDQVNALLEECNNLKGASSST